MVIDISIHVLLILQGLPGIGPKKAKNLLTIFGSIEGIIAAHVEELQLVDGIGKSIAEKIKWAVCEEKSVYGSSDERGVGKSFDWRGYSDW